MATAGPSGSTKGIPEHPNLQESEENILKYSFLKMLEILNEGMKKPLKKWRERKKLEEIDKSLKESQESKKKSNM